MNPLTDHAAAASNINESSHPVADFATSAGNDHRLAAGSPPLKFTKRPTVEQLTYIWQQPYAQAALASSDVANAYRVLQRVGVSQRAIAALTGQAQSEVSEILAGRKVQHIEVITRIVDGLALPRMAFGLAPTPTRSPYATLPTWLERPSPPPAADGSSLQTARADQKSINVQTTNDPQPVRVPTAITRPATPTNKDADNTRTHVCLGHEGPCQHAAVAGTPPSLWFHTETYSGDLGITCWTGLETRLLRLSRRMSVREFANHLGISDRMVSKWEQGADNITPRPGNQSLLDTSLYLASPEEKARFAAAWQQPGPANTAKPTTPLIVADPPGVRSNF